MVVVTAKKPAPATASPTKPAASPLTQTRPRVPAVAADKKRAILLEYDAIDDAGRQDLLTREGISSRDIARWRRDAERRLQAATTPPAEPRRAPDSGSEIAADVAGEPPRPADPPPVARHALMAPRGDVVAAHANALVYHAETLSKLLADAQPLRSRRRHAASLERLAEDARAASEQARAILSTRRPDGIDRTNPSDSVDVSAEVVAMLSALPDASSLALAVRLLAQELESSAETPPDSHEPKGLRRREPWWGHEKGGVGSRRQ